jgi:anti-sigma-K factor RskA
MNPDRDRLAAEHALGLLEGEERRHAENLIASDVAFQRAVAQWQAHFAELDETAAPVPAGEDLWQRIEGGLTPQAETVRATDASPVVVPDPRTALIALWRSLPFWRIAGLAGSLAAVALAIGLAIVANERARQPVLVAVLLLDANRPGAVVNAFANGRAELVPIEAVEVPPGRALEIWTLWDRTRGPVSVGLIDRARTVRLNLENLPTPAPNQLFEISLEPAGGSPTGRPTGPVLMKGTAATPL